MIVSLLAEKSLVISNHIQNKVQIPLQNIQGCVSMVCTHSSFLAPSPSISIQSLVVKVGSGVNAAQVGIPPTTYELLNLSQASVSIY